MSDVLMVCSEESPQFLEVSDHRIFIPSSILREKLLVKCRKEILYHFSAGTYTNHADINRILQLAGRFYRDVMHRELKALATVQTLCTLLLQYEPMAKVDKLFLHGDLSPDEADVWQRCGVMLRYSQKLLIETAMLFQLREHPVRGGTRIYLALQNAQIAALEMLELNFLSDQIYYLGVDHSSLELFTDGPLLLTTSLGGCSASFRQRIKRDRDVRSKFDLNEDIMLKILEHSKVFSPAFEVNMHLSYAEVIRSLSWMIDALADAGPIVMIPKREFEFLAAGGLKMSMHTTKKILNGFTLTHNAVKANGRDRWNSRISQRLLARGMVQCRTRESSEMLFWNRSMAQEALLNLIEFTAYQRMPIEWTTDEVMRCLGQISLDTGADFEKHCQRVFESFGIHSLISQRNSIGTGQRRLCIPNTIGGLDMLAYSSRERAILLFECKKLIRAAEPVAWRGELDKFERTNGFSDKFTKKITWLKTNFEKVVEAMASTKLFGDEISASVLKVAFITFYPSIYAHRDNAIPCYSLSELVSSYGNSGHFPDIKTTDVF